MDTLLSEAIALVEQRLRDVGSAAAADGCRAEDLRLLGRLEAELALLRIFSKWGSPIVRLSAGPDDTIVLFVEDHLPRDGRDSLEKSFNRALPGHRVMVLCGGMRLGVVSHAVEAPPP